MVTPIHVGLISWSDLLRCMPSTCDLGQIAWRPTFHRLFDIVNRVWSVTRQVISLAPSDPLGESESMHAPAKHEIARAYEVLASVSVREDADDPMDHKNLLSGCWRATMEARCGLRVIT